MQDFQARVVVEKEELDKKIAALRGFQNDNFFKTLPQEEQRRLNKQEVIMSLYSDVLSERIANFK